MNSIAEGGGWGGGGSWSKSEDMMVYASNTVRLCYCGKHLLSALFFSADFSCLSHSFYIFEFIIVLFLE